MADTDYLLDIDTVKGESKDKKHPDTIEIMSWSTGVSNAGSSARGTGTGTGKASFQDATFTAVMSKASPRLFELCATGDHVSKATLFVRKAGGDQQEYLTIKMTDVFVTGVSTSGSGGNQLPMETVSISFAKIEYEYKPQDEKGKLGAAVNAGYDLKKGGKV